VRPLDWVVLIAALTAIVLYGMWKGRTNRNLDGYLLADRSMRWHMIALSIMATQASAITFLSTPGQAYVDGMRFVQFYFGLPLAMIVLSMTAVPLYRRFKVFTAYEFLERRFDGKTRSLAAFLFLIQRGLAAGLTIFAPSLVLSVLLGWNIQAVIAGVGAIVITYTAWGGTKTVQHTQFLQFLVIIAGMTIAFGLIVRALPDGVGFVDALAVAGKLGKLNTVDFSLDPNSRYTVWSGLLGGLFLQLSYFGTDQSQVGRYITGANVGESRLSLLFNGMVKVPMQFGILFLGALVFVFYTFVMPPVFFNPAEVRKLEQSALAPEFREVQARHVEAFAARERGARELVGARRAGDVAAEAEAVRGLRESHAAFREVRDDAVSLMRRNDPGARTNDTNYIFLSFVLGVLPVGVVGLVLAAIFSASMSSMSAELNALASTSIVDVWRRWRRRGPASPDADAATDLREVLASKLATVFWGAFAVGFAMMAGRLGSLVEAINILGSLFYGTILGIFLVAFFFKRVGGTAVFFAALVAEGAVIACYLYTGISFLWYNVIGGLLVIAVAHALEPLLRRRQAA
jgi:SSS family transporter